MAFTNQSPVTFILPSPQTKNSRFIWGPRSLSRPLSAQLHKEQQRFWSPRIQDFWTSFWIWAPNRDLLESVLKLQKVLETLLPPDFSLHLGSGLEVAVHENFWSRSSRFSEGFQDGTQNFLHALWVHPAADCLVFVIYWSSCLPTYPHIRAIFLKSGDVWSARLPQHWPISRPRLASFAK